MSQSFRSLLTSTTSDNVERPRALVAGHYIGSCKEHEFGVSSKKKTPYVRFTFVPEEETNDVEAGLNDGIDFAKKEVSKTLYITPQALYRLSDLLDAMLGKQPGRSLDERIPETRGQRVLMQITTRENDEGTETYNDVGTVVSAESM